MIAAATPITLDPSAALPLAAWAGTALLAAIAVLVGVIAWFLRREIRNNDAAHQELRADIKELRGDVKKLLAGDVAWVQALLKLR
ncbi:MAG: hypothetical protein OXH04_10320 [Acidobacteria bacterium]|nr:hypothetical protein [Acidobacteriota bacterium]